MTKTKKTETMELKEIQDLIKLVSKSNVGEVRIENKEFKLTIRNKEYNKNGAGVIPVNVTPVQQSYVAPPSIPQPVHAEPALAEVSVSVPETKEETAPKTEESSIADNAVTFKSPMIGTFYRSPSPDKPPFVKVGDVVEVGTILCIVEAMKLFNEIESEVSGKIVKIIADDSAPVEYDTPLFLIEPV